MSGKIRIEESALGDLSLDVDNNVGECCSLGFITGVGGRTTVDELQAARYESWDELSNRAVLVTTNPSESAVEPRLKAAGFTQVASWPRNGGGVVKLWIAATLKGDEVNIVEAEEVVKVTPVRAPRRLR